MLLLRCHRLCLAAVLGSVVLGAALSPGAALGGGRLSGVLWPVPPPQVAHYAATMFGTTVLLWMCKVLTGRHAALIVIVSSVLLVATHTRTALIGLFAGLLVGGASLFLGSVRVRRTAVISAGIGLMTVAIFANELRAWAVRGQDSTQITELTGRTKVWSAVMSQHRPSLENWFGSGMSNMSFNGLPIDSNWVATYQDQGWFGVALEAAPLRAPSGHRDRPRAGAAQGDQPLPHRVLPLRLHHRGGAGRAVGLSPRPDRGGVLAHHGGGGATNMITRDEPIIIASLAREQGITGVHTHVHQVREFLDALGRCRHAGDAAHLGGTVPGPATDPRPALRGAAGARTGLGSGARLVVPHVP